VRAVNLLPRDTPKKSFEAKRGVAFGAAGGAALVTVAMAALVLGASGTIQERQLVLDGLEADIAALPKPPPEDAAADAALEAEKAARIAALSEALAGRVAWDRLLREVSQVLPEDVWLTSLSSRSAAGATAVTPGAPAGTAGLVINGSTYSQSGVARFLSRLALVPGLTNVTLQSSSSAQAETGGTVVTFTMSADVRTPGAGS